MLQSHLLLGIGGCFRIDGEVSDVGISNRHLAHGGICDAKDVVAMLHVRDVGDGIVSRRHGDGVVDGRRTI